MVTFNSEAIAGRKAAFFKAISFTSVPKMNKNSLLFAPLDASNEEGKVSDTFAKLSELASAIGAEVKFVSGLSAEMPSVSAKEESGAQIVRAISNKERNWKFIIFHNIGTTRQIFLILGKFSSFKRFGWKVKRAKYGVACSSSSESFFENLMIFQR